MPPQRNRPRNEIKADERLIAAKSKKDAMHSIGQNDLSKTYSPSALPSRQLSPSITARIATQSPSLSYKPPTIAYITEEDYICDRRDEAVQDGQGSDSEVQDGEDADLEEIGIQFRDAGVLNLPDDLEMYGARGMAEGIAAGVGGGANGEMAVLLNENAGDDRLPDVTCQMMLGVMEQASLLQGGRTSTYRSEVYHRGSCSMIEFKVEVRPTNLQQDLVHTGTGRPPALVTSASDIDNLLFSHKSSRFELWRYAVQHDVVLQSRIQYSSSDNSDSATFTVYYIPPQKAALIGKFVAMGARKRQGGHWYYGHKAKRHPAGECWQTLGRQALAGNEQTLQYDNLTLTYKLKVEDDRRSPWMGHTFGPSMTPSPQRITPGRGSYVRAQEAWGPYWNKMTACGLGLLPALTGVGTTSYMSVQGPSKDGHSRHLYEFVQEVDVFGAGSRQHFLKHMSGKPFFCWGLRMMPRIVLSSSGLSVSHERPSHIEPIRRGARSGFTSLGLAASARALLKATFCAMNQPENKNGRPLKQRLKFLEKQGPRR